MAGEPREEPETEKDQPAQLAEAAAPVVTRSGYTLRPAEPLPELASPAAQAYAVDRDGGAEGQLFALVFESLLPRLKVLKTLAAAAPAGMLRIVDCSVVDWPPLGRRAIAAIFELPEGGRLKLGEDRLTAQEVVQKVVWPVARTLRNLASFGVAHRALRVDNLFWADIRRSAVVLGECVSAPPGSTQPVAYETRGNAVADPMGRAEGSESDDLYALAVTVLELTCKDLSWRELGAKTLAQRKLDFGTAATLMVGAAPPPELMPLLRGLLADDEEQRWGLDELEAWLRQERIPHHAAAANGPPGKALRIGQEQIRNRGAAAAAIALNPRAALAVARSGALAEWLRNGLRDAGAATTVEAALRTAQRFAQGGKDADAVLAARLAMMIDPEGPVRFGEVTVMPEAFGTLLGAAMVDGRKRDDLMAIVKAGLLSDMQGSGWAAAGSSRGDALQFALQFGTGAGPERCAYELNPDLPCLSPAMRAAYVLDLGAFMRQLELLARTADFRNSPLDTHGAAFLAQRLALGRQRIANLATRQPLAGERAVLELRLLAAAQIAAGNPPLPLLANWISARIAPIPGRIHNRRTRKEIGARLAAARETGRLIDLLTPLDSQQAWDEDQRGFDRARHLFSLAGAEMSRLRAQADIFARRATARGREVAVAVSAFAGFAVVVLAIAIQAL